MVTGVVMPKKQRRGKAAQQQRVPSSQARFSTGAHLQRRLIGEEGDDI
jgi:hypothetical protein